MAADNLVGAVASDALGAITPTAHMPFGVEHVDGVIAHALEQEAVVLLGFAQRAFRLLALGHVEADAEHARGGAVFIAHDLADALEMADAAIGPDDALFMAEARAGFERRADAGADPLAVVGMNMGEKIVDGPAELRAREPVDVEELVRPGNAVGNDVP